jgi:hypothetical protein
MAGVSPHKWQCGAHRVLGGQANETYPQTKEFNGGFCVLEFTSRSAAIEWAAKIARSCRYSQELREFLVDPES